MIYLPRRHREKKNSFQKIRNIPLELIDDFPDHPFKVRDDEDMNLFQDTDESELVELAGFETLRSDIVDLNRDEATILMVESNFRGQRYCRVKKPLPIKCVWKQ